MRPGGTLVNLIRRPEPVWSLSGEYEGFNSVSPTVMPLH